MLSRRAATKVFIYEKQRGPFVFGIIKRVRLQIARCIKTFVEESISLPRIVTARPSMLVIFTISLMVPLLLIIPHIDNLAAQRGSGDHGWAHQQSSSLRAALTTNEITIR